MIFIFVGTNFILETLLEDLGCMNFCHEGNTQISKQVQKWVNFDQQMDETILKQPIIN